MSESNSSKQRAARLIAPVMAMLVMLACAVPFVGSNTEQTELEGTAESLSATLTALPGQEATAEAEAIATLAAQPVPDISGLNYDSLTSGLEAYGLDNLRLSHETELRLQSHILLEEDLDTIFDRLDGEVILPPKRVPTELVQEYENIREALESAPIERKARETETLQAGGLEDLAAQRETLAENEKIMGRVVPVVSVEEALTPGGGTVEVMSVRDLFSGRHLLPARNWSDGETFLWVLAPELDGYTPTLARVDDDWAAPAFEDIRASNEANPATYVGYLAEGQTWPERFLFVRGDQRHIVSEWSLKGLHLAVSFPHNDEDSCVWWVDLPTLDPDGNPLDLSDNALRDFIDITLAPSENDRTSDQFAYVRGDVTLSDEPRLREIFGTMLDYPPEARAFILAFQEEMYITNRPEQYGAIGLGGNGIVAITPDVLNDYDAEFSGSVILHERVHSWQFETLQVQTDALVYCGGRIDAEYEAYMIQQLALWDVPGMDNAARYLQDLIRDNTYGRGDDES